MLKITKSEDCAQKQCTPNILPCRIHHDGAVDASPRYWASETAESQSPTASLLHLSLRPIRGSCITDRKPEAYFRGRKLRGQEIDVPLGYGGVIVKEAGKEKTVLQNTDTQILDGEEGEEQQEEVIVLNEIGSFEKVIVWSHESMVDGDDAFVKGLSEWIGFAEAVGHLSLACRQRYMDNRC